MNVRSIQEHWGEIKGQTDTWLADWGVFAVIILACLASFGLGRLSMLEGAKPDVRLSQAPLSAKTQPISPGGMLVGSVSGDTYHYPWCAGATKIATQNQRWFATVAAALSAGYRPAKNCAGLE